MSITFTCMDAPRDRIPCSFCEEWRREGWISSDEKCDPYCEGTEDSPSCPEVNFANANARALLTLLGFDFDPEDPYGSCSGAVMRQRILLARNRDRSIALRSSSYTPPPLHLVSNQTQLGASIYIQGSTDADTLRRLNSLEKLAIYAQEHDFEISWA